MSRRQHGVREKLEVAATGADEGRHHRGGLSNRLARDFEAVKAVAEQIKGPRIAGLARCMNKDIERCAEAIAPAGGGDASMCSWPPRPFIVSSS